tara:strand:- start:256 stop:567 length:312 start_codon:yes stop_codon:yes gene_type:complete
MFTAADTRRAHYLAKSWHYAEQEFAYRQYYSWACKQVQEEKRAADNAAAIATACIIIGKGQAEHAAHLATIDTRGRWFHALAAAALTAITFAAAPAYTIAVSL